MSAKDDWVEIYDGYTDEELASEINQLKENARNPYVNQTEGNRGYTRSTNEDRVKFAAATQVQRERSSRNQRRHGQADFSNFQ